VSYNKRSARCRLVRQLCTCTRTCRSGHPLHVGYPSSSQISHEVRLPYPVRRAYMCSVTHIVWLASHIEILMHYSVVLSKAFRRLALWTRTCPAKRVTGCLSGVPANVVDAHPRCFEPAFFIWTPQPRRCCHAMFIACSMLSNICHATQTTFNPFSVSSACHFS